MEGGGATVTNRAEIDTSAPFRSVKEAVMLFGERVLAGEIYANKLKEMQDNKTTEQDHRAVASELEETKQCLQKAREESLHVARSLSSLQKELEEAKRELHRLKTRAPDPRALDSETEDLKYVEFSNPMVEVTEGAKMEMPDRDINIHQTSVSGFEKKKCVSFANQRPVVRVIAPSPSPRAVLQRHHSLNNNKKKKKQIIPFIAGIFSKKRGSRDAALA